MLSKLVLVHSSVWALTGCKLLPETLDISFGESFWSQRVDSFFKNGVRDLTAPTIAEVYEKVENTVTARKCRLHHILKLNDKLVWGIERFECISPVIDVHESFFVWIELGEKFLDQRLSQVEPLEGVLAVQKFAELSILQFWLTLSGFSKAFLDIGIFLWQH